MYNCISQHQSDIIQKQRKLEMIQANQSGPSVILMNHFEFEQDKNPTSIYSFY